VPRAQGTPSQLAGPKIANFDRVEWQVIPDPATAAAALQQGEIDWWDQPIVDLLPTLKANKTLNVELLDPIGNVGVLRFNHTQPPFDNPAIRRAVLSAISQKDFMSAIAGEDTNLWRDKVGYFAPGGNMANDAGMEALTGPRDITAAAKAIKDAGYKGEKVVLIAPGDFPVIGQMSEVTADLFRKLGFNLDYAMMDWGSMLRRMANRETPDKGGYSAFCTYSAGVTQLNPSAHNFIRGSGDKATFGWAKSERLEQLRDAWFAAPDAAAQEEPDGHAQGPAIVLERAPRLKGIFDACDHRLRGPLERAPGRRHQVHDRRQRRRPLFGADRPRDLR
jgi:peptide/nickel transport system substrate-binding protein